MMIPTVIEKHGSQEHAYDLYSCLLKERIILLTGEINDQLSSSICAQLLYLASTGNEPIIMYLNSVGGSVSAGLAIFDIMKYIPNDIITIDMGICASMAAILLSAGTKGKRYILPNSEVMIHQPLGQMGGQAKDMEIAATHIIKMKERLYKILATTCDKDIHQVATDCDRDYYLNANEALAYGLVDEIITVMDQET